MRKVVVSDVVQGKITELELFLQNELMFSKEAALKRSNRMRVFVKSLCAPANYPLCRFKRWQLLGYRCAVFEKKWIFAYEIFEEGIIVRDMAHTSLLAE